MTYTASCTVPKWATCVMSALLDATETVDQTKVYTWHQPIPLIVVQSKPNRKPYPKTTEVSLGPLSGFVPILLPYPEHQCIRQAYVAIDHGHFLNRATFLGMLKFRGSVTKRTLCKHWHGQFSLSQANTRNLAQCDVLQEED